MRAVYLTWLLTIIISMTGCQSEARLINQIILQLGSNDPSVVAQSYDRLEEIGGRVITPLIGALKDNDNAEVRCAAAWALGQTGDERAIIPLIEALGDSNEKVSQWAAGALLYIGQPAISPLISALKSEDIMTKIASAEILGQIADTSAVLPLIDMLEDNDSTLKQVSILALANIGDEHATAYIVESLNDSSASVREAAVEGLVKIGPSSVQPLINAMYDGISCVIQQDETLLEIRQEAALALGRIGDKRAIQPLITALADSDPYFSWDAAGALALIGQAAAVPLIPLLDVDDSQLVRKAAWVLGQIKDSKAVDPLIKVMQERENPYGQAAFQALSGMGEVAQEQLQTFLLRALQKQDLKVIAAGYDFYIRRGDVAAEPALIAALNMYANAYGNYDDNGMVAMAERFLNCGNERLRQAAIGWANGNAFQIVITPAQEIFETWGPGVYEAYCGQGMVRWGDSQHSPSEVYVLWRGINEPPGLIANYGTHGFSVSNRPPVIGRNPGTIFLFHCGSPHANSSYLGHVMWRCPEVSWKVDVMTVSAGIRDKSAFYVGDRLTWKVGLTEVNSWDRMNIKLITKIDGVVIDDRLMAMWRENSILWLPYKSWTATGERLHTVVFEIYREDMKCDSHGWQFPVLKKPLERTKLINGRQWLCPRVIDGWQQVSG